MSRVFLASVIFSLIVTDTATAQPAPEAIFSTVNTAVTNAAMRSMTVLPKGVADRRIVGMRLDRLFDGNASHVLLNIDAHQWVAAFERLDSGSGQHRVWVGSIEGIPQSHVSFAERDGVVSGLVNAVSETYAVRTVVPGTYALDRVLPIGDERQPVEAPRTVADRRNSAARTVANDSAATIDVMLLYTQLALNRVGGVANMNALLNRIISDTNTVFERSGITTRVRLVNPRQVTLVETSDMSADLDALAANASIRSARDAAGADLVQLLQSSTDQACGIAFILTPDWLSFNSSDFSAYSIADVDCVDQYTPTHEMGHNMGAHHDPLNASGSGAFPYSYGYQRAVSPNGFRTVMAYSCSGGISCPRIANMSSASVLHNGAATGNSGQNNAQSINNTALTVANFRQSTISAPTAPSAPIGLTAAVSGLNVTLSWNAGTSDLNWSPSAATAYVLQVGSAPGVYNIFPALPLGNMTSISGSGPAATYYWRVYGTNSAGNGVPSAEASFTLGNPCVPPSAPQSFTHTVGAGGVVTLNWSTPVSGTAPFSYIIDAGTATGLSDVLVAPVGAVTSLAVTAPPGRYFVRIRASNACAATSPVSNERTIIVP